jgi:hypothetical protein
VCIDVCIDVAFTCRLCNKWKREYFSFFFIPNNLLVRPYSRANFIVEIIGEKAHVCLQTELSSGFSIISSF